MLANLRPVYRPLLPVCRAAAAPAAGESPRRAGRVLQHGSTAARRHGGVFCSRLVPDISPAQPRCSSFPSTLFRNPAQNSIRAIHFWSDYILHKYLETRSTRPIDAKLWKKLCLWIMFDIKIFHYQTLPYLRFKIFQIFWNVLYMIYLIYCM